MGLGSAGLKLVWLARAAVWDQALLPDKELRQALLPLPCPLLLCCFCGAATKGQAQDRKQPLLLSTQPSGCSSCGLSTRCERGGWVPAQAVRGAQPPEGEGQPGLCPGTGVGEPCQAGIGEPIPHRVPLAHLHRGGAPGSCPGRGTRHGSPQGPPCHSAPLPWVLGLWGTGWSLDPLPRKEPKLLSSYRLSGTPSQGAGCSNHPGPGVAALGWKPGPPAHSKTAPQGNAAR